MEFLPLAFLALPFVLWGVLVWTRRARCRQTAERLRGRCIQQGAFETGAIVGDDFAVEPMKVGKSVRTTVRVAADGCPNDFVLRQGFFAALGRGAGARAPGARDRAPAAAWSPVCSRRAVRARARAGSAGVRR